MPYREMPAEALTQVRLGGTTSRTWCTPAMGLNARLPTSTLPCAHITLLPALLPALLPMRPVAACLQVFQAYILLLAQSPEEEWGMPEELMGLAQDAWVQSTKKIK